VYLISEDLNLDLQKAWKALEDSAEYGWCKFPATNEDIKQHLIQSKKGKGKQQDISPADSDVIVLSDDIQNGMKQIKQEIINMPNLSFHIEVYNEIETIIIDDWFVDMYMSEMNI
jgi:hypothetical protein